MNLLSTKDYDLFCALVSTSPERLKGVMTKFLQQKYKNVIVAEDYIVAVGDISIALVAHLDTVFTSQPSKEDVFYDKEKNIIWARYGLGADDRLGVLGIIKIINDYKLRPSIIFTLGEEEGGIGATNLALSGTCPIPNLHYMIELDRQGRNDCVFYDCDVEDFIKYVEDFGFVTKKGTFSDITFLMEYWGVCGTNLSIGYQDEHTYWETANITYFFETIEKVVKMLTAEDIPCFIFKTYSSNFDNMEIKPQQCDKCKKIIADYNLIPVIDKEGKALNYCLDCFTSNPKIEWCTKCGEAFIKNPKYTKKVCKKCRIESLKTYQKSKKKLEQ